MDSTVFQHLPIEIKRRLPVLNNRDNRLGCFSCSPPSFQPVTAVPCNTPQHTSSLGSHLGSCLTSARSIQLQQGFCALACAQQNRRLHRPPHCVVVVVVRTRVQRTCLCRYERTARATNSGRTPGSQDSRCPRHTFPALMAGVKPWPCASAQGPTKNYEHPVSVVAHQRACQQHKQQLRDLD